MKRTNFEKLLCMAVEENYSDLTFTVGKAPLLKFDEKIQEYKGEPLTAADTKLIASYVLDGKYNEEELDTSFKSTEVAYELGETGRFRVSVFKQRQNYCVCMRVIPYEVRSFDDLNLPEQVAKIAQIKRGLVLIIGATRQGKSTTLSAIIEDINIRQMATIITIEDPIEFIYRKSNGVIFQREVGDDVPDYQSGLRQALRQSPDVIMAGEIRDRETCEAVITASETGHLVLSALHSTDAVSTFDRIFGYYSPHEARVVRERLSNSLSAIIGLRLVPSVDGKLVPAVEILTLNGQIKECLKFHSKFDRNKIFDAMVKGRIPYGMQTFDQHLKELFETGVITRETALANATNADNLVVALDTEHLPG